MRRIFQYSLMIALAIAFAANPAQADYAGQSPNTHTLREIAETNGIEMTKFTQCVKDKKYADKITADQAEATTLGAQGTPFSIVLGPRGEKISVSGAVPLNLWQDQFDSLLGISPTPKPGNETPGALPTSSNVNGSITPIDLTKETVWGNATGTLTVIIYTDFDCPFCKKLHETMIDLGNKYPKDLRWVYRNFPITSLHPTADFKANAVECAHEQAKSIGFTSDLFTYQDNVDISEFASTTPNPPLETWPLPPLADTYYARDIRNDDDKIVDQELVKIHGNGTDDTRTIIIPSIRKLFPELKKQNLFLDVFATPKVEEGSNYVIFHTVEDDAEKKSKEKFYRFDIKKQQLKAMKINRLYQGDKGPDVTVSTSEDRFFWTPINKKHSARQLYVFDLLTDTRKLIVSLPASQSLDGGDPKSTGNSIEVDWLDNNTIGYTVFSQTKKSKVAIDDPDWHTKLFVRDGLFKLKPVRY